MQRNVYDEVCRELSRPIGFGGLCRCIPDYSERGMTDPRCSWHDIGQDVVERVIVRVVSQLVGLDEPPGRDR